MSSLDPRIADALGRELPLREELEPAWDDVLSRKQALQVPRGRLRASRWAVAGAFAAAAALGVGGLAIADVVGHGPLHGAKLQVSAVTLPGGVSTCDLIGKPASRVGARLTNSGIGIEWRFMHWGTTTVTAGMSPAAAAQGHAQTVASAEAVTGGSSDAVPSVPADSVVWDVVPDGQDKAFVFVQAPNDPNAPTVSTDNCSG